MALREYLSRQNGGGLPSAADLTLPPTCLKGDHHSENRESSACSMCNNECDSAIRVVGSAGPPRCNKCSTSKSVYEMLREPPRVPQPQPQQRQEADAHVHKKLRPQFPRQNQLPTPPPSVSPSGSEPIAMTIETKVEALALRKRRHTLSLSTKGAIRIDGKCPHLSLPDYRQSRMVFALPCFYFDFASERHQRQLLASRDIAEGEIILKESPIISGPMAREFFVKKKLSSDGKEQPGHPKFTPICLTCCKNIQTNYKCTKCGFPMCSLDCEQVSCSIKSSTHPQTRMLGGYLHHTYLP